MDFQASTNHFFIYFFRDSCRRKLFIWPSVNLFLNESVIPPIGGGFFSLMETIILKFFTTRESRHCYKWKPIFKARTYSCWWKLIFCVVEAISFHCLIYFLRSPSSQLAVTHFSVRKDSIVFYSELSFLLVIIII